MVTVKDFFNENGYYISRNIIPLNIIEKIKNELNELLINFLLLKNIEVEYEKDTYYYLKQLFNYDEKIYGEFVKQNGVLARMQETNLLQFNNNILDMLKELGTEKIIFPSGPHCHIMSVDMKIKDGYFGIGVHQDYPSNKSSLSLITAWIPLTKVDANNNTLKIVPKSHLNGLVDSTYITNHYNIEDKIKEDDFIDVEMEPGDALFFSGFLIHKSGVVGTCGKVRMAVSFRYDNCEDKYFIENLYRTASVRTINKNIECIPSKEDILKIYK